MMAFSRAVLALALVALALTAASAGKIRVSQKHRSKSHVSRRAQRVAAFEQSQLEELKKDPEAYWQKIDGMAEMDQSTSLIQTDQKASVQHVISLSEGAMGKPGFSILVVSGGLPFGNLASIKINGKDQSKNGRGMNVVVLNPANGQIDWSDSYDTHASQAQSDRLANDLNALPSGRLVCVAVRDEAARNLNEKAKKALEGIGADLSGELQYRDSWAIIGVRGAQPGDGRVRESYNNRDKCAVTWTQQPDPVRGPRGTRGITGDPGSEGTMGPDGNTGNPGARGADGPVGPDGEKGYEGQTGEVGDPGAVGPRGPQGYEGGTGPPGQQGEPGRNGPPGPSGAPGGQGVMGPKGDTGAAGPKGDEGAQGEPGPPGLQGETGPQGHKGEKGVQGIQGEVGPEGKRGVPFDDFHEVEELERDTADLHDRQLELKAALHNRHLKERIKLAAQIKTEAMATEIKTAASHRARDIASPVSTEGVLAGYVAGAAAAGAGGAIRTEAIPDLLSKPDQFKDGIGFLNHLSPPADFGDKDGDGDGDASGTEESGDSANDDTKASFREVRSDADENVQGIGTFEDAVESDSGAQDDSAEEWKQPTEHFDDPMHPM